MNTATVYLVLALLAAAAVFLAGVPFRNRDESPSLALVWQYDTRLGQITVGVAASLLVAMLLGALGAPGAFVVLGLVAGLGTPIALDRWQRTNGSRSPYQRFRRLRADVAAVDLSEELQEQLAVRLLDDITEASDEMLKRLIAVTKNDDRSERLCRMLAGHALRVDRAGEIMWTADVADDTRDRDALQAVTFAHPAVATTLFDLIEGRK